MIGGLGTKISSRQTSIWLGSHIDAKSRELTCHFAKSKLDLVASECCRIPKVRSGYTINTKTRGYTHPSWISHQTQRAISVLGGTARFA